MCWKNDRFFRTSARHACCGRRGSQILSGNRVGHLNVEKTCPLAAGSENAAMSDSAPRATESGRIAIVRKTRHSALRPFQPLSCLQRLLRSGRGSSSACGAQSARLADEPSPEQVVLDFLPNRSKAKNAEAWRLTGITCDRSSKTCSRQQCRTHAQKDRCRTQREESLARGAPVPTLRRSPKRVRAFLRSRQHGSQCAQVSSGVRTGDGRCCLAQVRIQPVSQEARSSRHPRSTLRSRDEAGTSRRNQRYHQRTSGHPRSTVRR